MNDVIDILDMGGPSGSTAMRKVGRKKGIIRPKVSKAYFVC